MKMDYPDVRRLILRCSTELELSLVSGLLQQLPEAEQMPSFKELKPEYDDLVEAEKFW